MTDVDLTSFWYRSHLRLWRSLMALVALVGSVGSWFFISRSPLSDWAVIFSAFTTLNILMISNAMFLRLIIRKRDATPILSGAFTFGQMAARVRASRTAAAFDGFRIFNAFYYVAVALVTLGLLSYVVFDLDNQLSLQIVSGGALLVGALVALVWPRRIYERMHKNRGQQTAIDSLRSNRVGIGYLRPFVTDHFFSGSRPSGAALQALGMKSNFSFEAMFYWAVAGYGGAGIAIGGPGERLPPVGFWRIYCDDETWKSQVIDLISKARVVLIAVGTTKWVEWELAQVNDADILHKVILLFPPSDNQMQSERLTFLGERIGAFKGLSINKFDRSSDLLCAYLNDQGEPVGIYGFKDDMLSYAQALTVAVFELDRRLQPVKA